jgi:hypothetical protein
LTKSPPQSIALDPVPRGSTPTMSKCSVMSLGRIAAIVVAKSVAVAPGPPGLTKRGPMRSPVAGTLATLSVSVSPSGWS